MVTYPKNWNELKRQVYRRDNFTCSKCGKNNRRLHCHHIKPLSKGGSNSFSNLVTLCETCHRNRHPHMWVNLWVKWLVLFMFVVIGFSIVIIMLSKINEMLVYLFLIFVVLGIIKKVRKRTKYSHMYKKNP